MKKTQTFEFVAMWNNTAWVAATTTLDIMAQGNTIKESVDNLRETLLLSAIFNEADGRRPFESFENEPMSWVTDVRAKQASPVPRGRSSKMKAYRGDVTVEWNSK